MAGQVLDKVDKIIDLVSARPTITVKEIAKELGFSQERSVYYWLYKAGYSGIKSLKNELLRASSQDANTGAAKSGPAVPANGRTQALEVRESGPYSVIVSTRSYEPWIRAGDELYVDPTASVSDGDLVLIDLPGEPEALYRAYPERSALRLVRLGDPRAAFRIEPCACRIRGVVIRLVRGNP